MENVNEKQQAKQIEPAEALAQLKKLFDSIPNPFTGSRIEAKIQNEQVEMLFEIIAESLQE